MNVFSQYKGDSINFELCYITLGITYIIHRLRHNDWE